MMITVLSCSLQMRSIRSTVVFPVAGSRFASGSSNRRISTSSTRTPPIETRCFCPPDSSDGACFKKCSIPTICATSSTFRNSSSCGWLSFSRENARSSATVSPMNWPSVSCRTVPTCLDMPKMPASSGDRPHTESFPDISPGRASGIRPLIQCTMVDFPQPEGPVIRIFSPFLTFRLMCCRVGSCCARYLNEKSENSMMGKPVSDCEFCIDVIPAFSCFNPQAYGKIAAAIWIIPDTEYSCLKMYQVNGIVQAVSFVSVSSQIL